MFTTQCGLFWMFMLCCCNKSQAKLYLQNRTSVALAGSDVIHKLKVTVPANNTICNIKCYHKKAQVWEGFFNFELHPNPHQEDLFASINMHNSSSSGEYYFEYIKEKAYWAILVRDVGYQPDTESSVVPLLLGITIVLLLVSVIGSVYIFMWCKNNSSSKGNKVNGKRKRNTVTKEEAKPDSVYTALNHMTVSVYDVLNVDEARSTNRESQRSQNKAKPLPEEDGVFESVYENL